MGKHLRRKHSYVRVEDDHPGCIWTVFHMINYHPWHNVRKMLPYKKHNKHHDKSNTSSKEIKPDEMHEIGEIQELKEDSNLKYSASVNSSTCCTSKNSSRSKRSIKARIKGLIKDKDKDNSRESDLLINHEPNNVHEHKSEYDASAPTLTSLLKANPKIIRSVDKSSEVKPRSHVKRKDSKEEDYVGVLELFNVDQDLFIRVLQDCPATKPRLVKSGSFPSRNGSFEKTPPSKLEQKHNEVWPINNKGELRKAKSQGVFTRSSSFTDSLERHGYLFDSSSNKAIKKHLSKSFKLPNEKESVLLNDLQSRRSFKERLHLLESEFQSFSMSDTSRPPSLERWNSKINGESKGWRLDSPREIESLTKSQLDEQGLSTEEQLDSEAMTSNCETNDGLTSYSAIEVSSLDDEVETVEWPLLEESTLVSSSSFSRNIEENTTQELEYYNEELQYVKYVLDIAGFATGDNQQEQWHAQNQPLDPALFDGIEVCCPFEPNSSSSKDSMFMSSYDRNFLFDLINEALIDTHERSYSNYYPKALSYWCHVWPERKGKTRNIEEVWEFVREYLSWRPELDPLLDLAVADDLSRDKNGWVNLQLDTEELALELEDLIFDELLDEIVCY